MAHAAGDAGWIAWTNGVDSLTAAHTADLAGKLDSTVASSTYVPIPAVATSHQLFVTSVGNDANSGTDWAHAKATIQNAYASLPSTGGEILVANTGGSAVIQELLPMTVTAGKPVRIRGQGGSTSSLGTHVNGTVGVSWTFQADSVVEDIYFDANGSTLNAFNINAKCAFSRVSARSWANSFSIDTSVSGNANLSTFLDCLTTLCTGAGFYMTGGNSQHMTFTNCNATGNTGWGFDVGACAHNVFVSCHADSNAGGAFRDAGNSTQFYNPYVEGAAASVVTLSGNYGVWIGSSYADPVTFTATTNYFVVRQGALVAPSLRAGTYGPVLNNRQISDTVSGAVIDFGFGAATYPTANPAVAATAIGFATPGGVKIAAVTTYTGSGVPSFAPNADGDIYFRSDGGAGTTIYQRRAGAWVATAA